MGSASGPIQDLCTVHGRGAAMRVCRHRWSAPGHLSLANGSAPGGCGVAKEPSRHVVSHVARHRSHPYPRHALCVCAPIREPGVGGWGGRGASHAPTRMWGLRCTPAGLPPPLAVLTHQLQPPSSHCSIQGA